MPSSRNRGGASGAASIAPFPQRRRPLCCWRERRRVFRATGVLDFDAELSASGVHIAPSAPRAEYYDVAQSYSAAEEPALARYAQIESDGAMVAGDAEDAMAPEASDIAPRLSVLGGGSGFRR